MKKSPTIILTADETMMSRYRGGMFLGFSTCSPRGIMPDWMYFAAFAPPVPRKDGKAVYSDFGLRILEASLLEDGFGSEDVAIVHPRDMNEMVGQDTRIVGIGAHDPLGINPPTSTFVDMVRTGPPYNRLKFTELLNNLSKMDVNVVVGGKGAWQVADTSIMDRLGIDYVHLGEGELSVPRMFRSIINGEDVPRVVTGEDVPVEKIPKIRGPTTHGLVEASRGCCRACAFCTPSMWRIRHKPVSQILHDAYVNAKAGNHAIILHSEDMLLYGAKGINPDSEKVMNLVNRVASLSGVNSMSLSHIALATAYHNRKLVEDISEAFSDLPDHVFNCTQTGVETGSPRLMETYMKGKALPAKPEMWPEIVVDSLGFLDDNNWACACTLISGLPGETEDDVLKTLELMDELKQFRMFYVPMNFVSMGPSFLCEEKSFTVDKMTPAHWMLVGECIEHDVRLSKQLGKYFIERHPLINMLSGYAMNKFINGAQSCARRMKDGYPPQDYTSSSSYLNPQI
jgi:radical SAM superfamily enzyme YgiQ (UPF0313 family)